MVFSYGQGDTRAILPPRPGKDDLRFSVNLTAEPLGIYWYEFLKPPDGKVVWARHVIDYSTRAGGGIQIATADINGDGRIDFAAGGESGLFLFLNGGLRRQAGE